MVESVRRTDENVFMVRGEEPNKHYIVNFGNENEFCNCTCPDYMRHRLLCKHFFAVIRKGYREFSDISPLFKYHPYTTLDESIFESNNAQTNLPSPSNVEESGSRASFEAPSENETVDGPSIDFQSGMCFFARSTIFKHFVNFFLFNIFLFSMFAEPLSTDNSEKEIVELPQRVSSLVNKRRNLISKMKQLTDLCYLVSHDTVIEELTEATQRIIDRAKSHLQTEGDDFIVRSPKKAKSTKSAENVYQQLPKTISKKHPYSGRVGRKAEMMRQFYRAKLELPDGDDDKDDTIIPTFSSCIPDTDVANEVVIDGTSDELIVCTKHKTGDRKRTVTQYAIAMEKEIANGQQLTHRSINYAQFLLHKQFPALSGLEDTSDLVRFSREPTGKFVQILHNDENHWVAISSAHPGDFVRYYDSLNTDSCSNKKIVNTIADVVMCKRGYLEILSAGVQQQKNAVDCGVFAIAYATDVAFGIMPAESSYDVATMRLHLLRCLEQGEMKPFPSTLKRVKRCRQIMSYIGIYCVCRRPFYEEDLEEDKGLFMACCCSCEEWFHRRCEKIPVAVFKDDQETRKWRCSSCRL